jgi:hypothetical protein
MPTLGEDDLRSSTFSASSPGPPRFVPGGPIRFQEAARTPEPAPAGSVDSSKRLFRPIVAGDQGAGLRSCVRPAPIYDCK